MKTLRNTATFVIVGLWVLGGTPVDSQARPHRNAAAVVCKDNRTITMSGRLINAGRVAVTATDNCTLTIRDSDLTGGRYALRVTDNATVTVVNSIVEDGRAAIHISGNGDVKASGSTIIRGVRKTENGDFTDEGGNQRFKRRRRGKTKDPKSGDGPALKKAKSVRCVGSGHVTIKNKLIDTRGEALGLFGTCSASIINSHIRAKVAINAAGTGMVKIRNSTIEGRSAAVTVAGAGHVYAKDSVIKGPIEIVGTGKFHDEGGNTLP